MSLMPALYLLPLILAFFACRLPNPGALPCCTMPGVSHDTDLRLVYACLFASMYCAHCLCVTYIGIVCGHLVKPPPPVMGGTYCTLPAHGIRPYRTLPSVLGLVLVFGLGLGVMLTWKNRPHDKSSLRVDLLSWHRHPRRAPCSLTP